MAYCDPTTIFGADPLTPVWKVVRGDSASLRIQFLENNEVDAYPTEDWTYIASVYDYKGDVVDELQTTAGVGYVDVIATPEISAAWGLGYRQVVSELAFDLQVTAPDFVWTPVIGTIIVIGDVTGP